MKTDLTVMAGKYKELALQIKELEKQADPLKKQLLDYAKKISPRKAVDIGEVVILPRFSTKASIDKKLITPDWIYKAQQSDVYKHLEIGLNKNAVGDGDAQWLLNKVGFSYEEKVSYAIML